MSYALQGEPESPARVPLIALRHHDRMIISGIIAQHAEEAADLWLLRDACAHDPQFRVRDLRRLDERVEAHVDALRIAGEGASEVVNEILPAKKAAQVFALSLWTFAVGTRSPMGTRSKMDELYGLGTSSPEVSRGLISALGWLPFDTAEPHIQHLVKSEYPAYRRAAISAAAVHRRNTRADLQRHLADPDRLARARALRAVGETGVSECFPALLACLNDDSRDCRFWAAWSLALRSDNNRAIAVLTSELESRDSPYRMHALELVLQRMAPVEASRLAERLRANRGDERTASIAAGILGWCDAIPWLLEQMKVTAMARVAAAAFTMITGLDLAHEQMRGSKPEEFAAGPTDDPEDDNVESDEDEGLPWPDVTKLESWWYAHADDFAPRSRCLLGKPLSVEGLNHALRAGRQRERSAAALELAVRSPGEPLFNIRMPGFRQVRLLGITK